MVNGGKRTPGGLMGRSPGGSKASLAGVRSPPLRGGFRARMAFRREPWHNAKGDFLGGTHSVRPRCEAVPMPRHNMIVGGKRTPGGLMGRSSDPSKVPLAGVRSPPLQGWAIQARTALRGKPGDGAEGGFLGGTHSVRPHCEAVPMPRHVISRDGRAKGPRRNGDVPRSSPGVL